MWLPVVVLLAVAGAGILLWRTRAASVNVAPDPDRNVLLITIDTLRVDALGFAGGEAETPNLDRLSREGLRFDFAHSHAVVTLPSHASILTGLYPFQHGIRDNTGYRLRRDLPTLATLLEPQGFATAAFVGAFPLDSRFGLDRGFDEYDDRFGSTNAASDLLMPERRADAVVQAATAWIGKQTGKWFAWVHVFDPHAPYSPPAPFAERYRNSPYAGEVAYTDSMLGPLLDVARGRLDTITVVTADHGEALGSHGEETHGVFAYEPSLHVPLILHVASAAGRFGRPDRVRDARHVDIVPTILDLLGMQVPGSLPGRPLLRDSSAASDDTPPSYFEALSASLNRGWAPLQGVIVGRDKYIELPIPELYDLVSYKDEQRNLHAIESTRAARLRKALQQFGATTEAGARTTESAEAIARLKALGYVSGNAPRKTTHTAADDPKNLVKIDQAIQRGVALFQQGKPTEALVLYRDLITTRPNMAVSYLHAAFLQWDLGDPAGAISTLRTAMRQGAVNAELQAQLGVYLAEAGDPQEAIAVLQPIASQPDADVEALNAMGIAWARAGRTKEALDTFRRILEIDRTNGSALQNIGTVYLETNDLAAARDAFSKALAIDPTLARAHNGLGAVEMKSGRRDLAIEAWKRAVAIDPRQYDTLYNLGTTLLQAGDRAGARLYLGQFLATAPPAFYGPDLVKVRSMLATLN